MNLEEGNSDSLLKNILPENDNILKSNNDTDNENNDICENKINEKNREEKEEKEKKEMIAKIKDRNNEKNFINKNVKSFINKNINSINNIGDKFLEMQLFNLDSFQINNDKNKETEKINEEIKENKEINNYNILQNIEVLIPKEISNILEKKEEAENFTQKEEEMINKVAINEEDNNKEKENYELKERKQEKEQDNEKIIKEKEINKEKKMEKEEYVFEKFGKLGWECEKCNNFNFESRTICNRCEAPKQPKSLEQIKIENEQKNGEKKKKPLIERKGDWQCPLCHNLNFAFRVSCNRCKLPKEVYIKLTMQQQKMNENMINNNINLQNNYVPQINQMAQIPQIPQIPQTQIINNTGPQLIQNQYNIIHWGYMPMYNPPFSQNPFNQTPSPNINNINNICNNSNNYKRKYKYYK